VEIATGLRLLGRWRPHLAAVEFSPMQIKLALAGSGHAEKHEVLEAVMRELALESPPRPDDAADALAVALTGWFQR
jgi:crossover junction endodeoxyribonuclease RuvC